MRSKTVVAYLTWAVFAALLLGCGCGSCVPAPSRHLTRQVQASEVIGLWQLRSNSLSLLIRDGFVSDPSHAYTIEFRADGTFTFKSVVDDFQSGIYLEADGAWSLEHGTHGNSNIKKANALRFEIEHPAHAHLSCFNFTEDSGVLTLWSYYSDPDQWEFIEYQPVHAGHAVGDE